MKTAPALPIPLSSSQVLDMSFLENRARLLEIAAFLDRVDRCSDAGAGKIDFRYQALVSGLQLLLDRSDADRIEAIQMNFSDPTADPIVDARGLKAHGAWNGVHNEGN
jgi:hypothetical protein